MFEKVNPSPPDKVADRIAGAIVDLAYERENNPRVAVEVLLGHGYVYIIVESSVQFDYDDVEPIVNRIYGDGASIRLLSIPQDIHLANNQHGAIRCGDNGIFKGCTPTKEQRILTDIAGNIYKQWPTDGKYILAPHEPKYIGPTDEELEKLDNIDDVIDFAAHICSIDNQMREHVLEITICQSHLKEDEHELIDDIIDKQWPSKMGCLLKINPLGEWTGGPDTDSGATNRKLGSDMGDGVTGGGLHGKDLSKADVSVNIWCFLQSQLTGKEVTATCSIGDEKVCGIPYTVIVETAREYIKQIGGFEKFAEWGLIRPTAPLTHL